MGGGVRESGAPGYGPRDLDLLVWRLMQYFDDLVLVEVNLGVSQENNEPKELKWVRRGCAKTTEVSATNSFEVNGGLQKMLQRRKQHKEELASGWDVLKRGKKVVLARGWAVPSQRHALAGMKYNHGPCRDLSAFPCPTPANPSHMPRHTSPSLFLEYVCGEKIVYSIQLHVVCIVVQGVA